MGWQTHLGTAIAVLGGACLALHSAGVQWQFALGQPEPAITAAAAIEPLATAPAPQERHNPAFAEAQLTELTSVVEQLMRDVADLKQALQQARDDQPRQSTGAIAQTLPPTPETLQQQLASAAEAVTAAERFVAQAPDLAVEATVQAGWNQLQAELVDAEFPAFTVDALRCGSTLCKVTFGHDQMDQNIVELLLSSMSSLGIESVELTDNSGIAYLAKASSRPLAMGVH